MCFLLPGFRLLNLCSCLIFCVLIFSNACSTGNELSEQPRSPRAYSLLCGVSERAGVAGDSGQNRLFADSSLLSIIALVFCPTHAWQDNSAEILMGLESDVALYRTVDGQLRTINNLEVAGERLPRCCCTASCNPAFAGTVVAGTNPAVDLLQTIKGQSFLFLCSSWCSLSRTQRDAERACSRASSCARRLCGAVCWFFCAPRLADVRWFSSQPHHICSAVCSH